MAYFIFYLFTFFMFHEMDAVNHKDGRVIDFKNILLFLYLLIYSFLLCIEIKINLGNKRRETK